MRALRMCFNSFRLECLSLLTFLAVSCVEAINLDPMEEMPVVVTCVLTTETTEQSLNLFYAKRPSETGYVSIPDAKVVVRDDGSAGGEVHEFKWNGEKYVCSFTPAYNTRYMLEVETTDGIRLSAETTTPDHYLMLPLGSNTELGSDTELKDYSNPLSGWPMGPGELVYWRNRVYYFARVTGTGAQPYSGELLAWITAGSRLSTNHSDADPFNLLPDNWCDLKVHPYFYYPLAEDSKEYLFFSAYPAYQQFIRIHQEPGFSGKVSLFVGKEKEEENNLFYLNSDVVDGSTVTANTDGIPDEVLESLLRRRRDILRFPIQNEYTVRFLSKDYDALLKQLIEKNIIHNEELAEIYSTEPVYSNVNGGLGIFGAESVGTAPFFSKRYVQFLS